MTKPEHEVVSDRRPHIRPVAVVTHSYYEEDPRVRREAEALVGSGRPVDVFSLRQAHDAPAGLVGGVRVHRLDVQRHQGAGLQTYLREYLSFLGRAGVALARADRRRRYGLVHVHTLPDFLVLAALPLRLAGVPVLLDLHEATPEFFSTRFPAHAHGILRHVVRLQERLSIAAASHAVTSNAALADRLIRLGVPAAKIDIVPNSPSLSRFDPELHPRRSFMADGFLRLIYAGALTPVYELDVAVAAVAELRARRPSLNPTLEIYGRGDTEGAIRAAAARHGVEDAISLHGRVALEEVPRRVAGADIGLAPTRLDRFTALSLSTKIFEYAAEAKPVVASNLPMIERTFGSDAIATYASGDPTDLAVTILRLVDDPVDREARVSRAQEVARELSWEREVGSFVALVDHLASDRRDLGTAYASG